jgi:hypothetical protein
LAEVYGESFHNFRAEIQKLVAGGLLSEIRVGALEGLLDLAISFSHHLLEQPGVRRLSLDVYDLNDLEEQFMKGNLEYIFTSREPGRKKLKYSRRLGYQSLEPCTSTSKGSPVSRQIRVMSQFEFGAHAWGSREDPPHRILVSNSLEVRRHWLARFGGQGVLPSPIHPKALSPQDLPVLMIAAETLPQGLWEENSSFKLN